MDINKTEHEDGNQVEKHLPRGLEEVSHLFLSRARPGRPLVDSPVGDPSQTVVLRASKCLAREQLVTLLKAQIAALEEGMKAIDAGIPCEIGSIDLLALDGTNHLTIVDVDDSANEGLLLRGIAHVDWATRNISNLRRMHQGQVINFSLQPRLVLVAPQFSPLFLGASRTIASPRITCLKYHTMAVAGGSAVLFEQVAINGVK